MWDLCRMQGRRRCSSAHEEAVMTAVFQDVTHDDIVAMHSALADTVRVDFARQAKDSLQMTYNELQKAHPEEAGDMARSRHRSMSHLSDFLDDRSGLEASGASVSIRAAPVGDVAASPEPPDPKEFTELGICKETTCLKDHEQLVRKAYEDQGMDFSQVQLRARQFLQSLGLRPQDNGVKNYDESGAMLLNQCFYLSIAHGYLGHQVPAQQVLAFALHLNRFVETAVLAMHPSWAADLGASSTGEIQAMVFADFLPVAMHVEDTPSQPNAVARLAVCVLDSVAGHVEVYLGPRYAELKSRAEQVANLVLLWYIPGHYQCLVEDDVSGSKAAMTYEEFKDLLVKHGVVYIETLE